MTNVTSAIIQTTLTEGTTTISHATTVNTSLTTETTTKPTTAIISTSTTATTTKTTTEQTTGNGGSPNSSPVGAIVGGVIGGIVAVLIVVLVLLWFRRRQRGRRNSGEVRMPPGKDYLDTLHAENAQRYAPDPTCHVVSDVTASTAELSPYENLTPSGETNENTDPSVGPDGYLKKTKNHLWNFGKKKNRKKKHGKLVETPSNNQPIYGNEIAPHVTDRQTSMPYGQAPSPPIDPDDGDGYTTGRVGKITGSPQAQNGKTGAKDYVNLQQQKKGGPVFGVAPPSKPKVKTNKHKKGTKETRTYINKPIANPDVKDNQEFYEDMEGSKNGYYNVNNSQAKSKNGSKSNCVSDDAAQLDAYENVDADKDKTNIQEDVYEAP